MATLPEDYDYFSFNDRLWSRDYNRAGDECSRENISTRVKDRTQIHQILSQVGLNPSDYIFSPLPLENSPVVSPSSYPSAFSSYSSHQKSDQKQSLKPQSQSLFTSGRPTSYVQNPAPGLPTDQGSSASQGPSNQQQGPPPSAQPGSSFASLLFGRSAPNTQNTSSQPPPPPPQQQQQQQSGSSFSGFPFGQSSSNTQNTSSQPPPPTSQQQQSGSSLLGSLFGQSSSNTQNTSSQPPPTSQQQQQQSGSSFSGFPFGQSSSNTHNTTSQLPSQQQQQQSGSSLLGSLFGPSTSNAQDKPSQPSQLPPTQAGTSFPGFPFDRSAPDTQNISSQSSIAMNPYNPSPRRTPPPPPHLICHENPSLSAEHYLRQINCSDHPPVRVVKPSTQNVVYRKEIRIRYLQPPTPPPPAPIIIREKHIPARPPESPLLIRERKPEARTPPPLTIRERPPTPPPPLEPYVIEKKLPPPPPQPRQIIIERLPTPPPKPRTVIFEKWLPYKKVKRPVLLQKAPPRDPVKPVRNVVIEYEPLKAFTVRRVIEEGVFRVDPHQYSAYNAECHSGKGDVRIVERIEDLPPPSEQLMRVLHDYNLPVRSSSTHHHLYNCHSPQSLSEHVPSNIQHLLADARPLSNTDQLTNVSRASSAPAFRPDRVLSTGYSSSSAASPTVVPIRRSRSKHYTTDDSPYPPRSEDIY